MKASVYFPIINDEIELEGVTTTPQREELIAEAIEKLQKDPDDFAKGQYYGIKNYAAFGDQREDYRHGCGPRHGSIKFRIDRGENFNPEKAKEYIELLLWLRKFPEYPGMEKTQAYGGYIPVGSLQNVVEKLDKAQKEVEKLTAFLNSVEAPEELKE